MWRELVIRSLDMVVMITKSFLSCTTSPCRFMKVPAKVKAYNNKIIELSGLNLYSSNPSHGLF